MDNRFIIPSLLVLCLVVGMANASHVTPLLQPNSTTTEDSYYYDSVSNLTLYFNYVDSLLNVIQDWNASIIFNNASSPIDNVTIPTSHVRWTLDYPEGKVIHERSINNTGRHSFNTEMWDDEVAWFLPFEYNVDVTHALGGYGYNASGDYSTTVNYTDCWKGSCMQFYDEGDIINVSIPDATVNTTINLHNFSYSMWVKPSTPMTYYPKLIYVWETTNIYELYLRDNNFCGGNSYILAFWAQTSHAGGDDSDISYYSDCYDFSDWTHVGVTVNDSWGGDRVVKLFINGTEVTYNYTQQGNATIKDEGTPNIHIGSEGSQSSYNDTFLGKIDEVYHFNMTMSAQQMLDLYRDPSCVRGYCFKYINGTNDYTKVQNHNDLRFYTSPFTVAAWVYLPVAPYTSYEHKIVNKGWAGANAWGLTHNGTELRFRMTDGAAATYSATCFGCLNVGEWNHVVGVFNQTGLKTYVNGVRGPVEVTKTGLDMSTASALELGATGVTGLIGSIDDVVIYKKVLSDQQIQFLYKNSFYTYGLDNGTYHAEMYFTDRTRTIQSNSTENTFLTYSQLNISIYDESNGSRVYDETTINLVGDEEYEITFNGESYLLEVLADTYDTIYSAKPQYAERYAVITANATAEIQQVKLYLGNTSTNVYATVYNEENDLVEGAIIYVYRRVGGDWAITESSATNIDGVALLHLVLDTELYKFVIEYEGGVVYTSEPAYIYSTEITFQISTGEESFEEYFTTESIIADVYFDHNNDRFVYNYIYDGASSTGCLRTYTVSAATGDTLVNETCLAATSAIIYHPVTATNGTTYRSDGYLDWGYEEQLLDSAMYTYPSLQPFKADGIFYQGLATTAVALTSFWSVTFAVVAVPASLILGKFIGLHDLQWYVLIALQVCSLIIIVIMRRAI